MATHSSIFTWEMPWPRSLLGYSPQRCEESDRLNDRAHTHACMKACGEEDGGVARVASDERGNGAAPQRGTGRKGRI